MRVRVKVRFSVGVMVSFRLRHPLTLRLVSAALVLMRGLG